MLRTNMIELQINILLDGIDLLLEKNIRTNRQDVLETLSSKLKAIQYLDIKDHSPFDKLSMIQQCILNTYYAIRRSNCGSEGSLFGKGSQLGNQLETFILENVKSYGGNIKIPHKVGEKEPTLRLFNPTIKHDFIKLAYEMLRVLKSKQQTLIDDMLEKLVLIDIGYEGKDEKKQFAAQLLVNNYYLLKRTKGNSSLTNALEKFLNQRGYSVSSYVDKKTIIPDLLPQENFLMDSENKKTDASSAVTIRLSQ